MRFASSPLDPLVALVAYLLVIGAVLTVFGSTRAGLECTARLLFLYLTYALFEIVIKRGAHYAWYVYPLKFGLFFLLLVVWLSARARAARPSAPPPLRGILVAYLCVAGVQVFNPYQANVLVGIMGWLTDFMFVTLYFVAFDLMKDNRFARRLLWVTAWLGLASAVVCFLEFWIGSRELQQMYPTFVQLTVYTNEGGVQYRPYCLVPFMEVFAIAAMTALLVAKERPWIFLYAGIVVCILASILHAVRITWAAALLFVAFFTLFDLRRRIVVAAVVAASIAGAAWVAVDITSGFVIPSLTSATTPIRTVQDTRLSALLALPSVVSRYPLGMGVGGTSAGLRFIDAPDVINLGAHNYFTALASQMSLAGPLLLFVFSFGMLRVGLRALGRPAPLWLRVPLAANLALFAALFASFFIGGGLGSYPVNEYYWLSAGIIGRVAVERTAAAPVAIMTARRIRRAR